MRRFLILLLVAATVPLSAKDNALTKAEAEEGWVLLFDGESLFGWNADAGTWKAANGVLEPPADGGRLRSSSAFADFALHLEYRVPSGDLDCSVLVRTALEGEPRQTGYELQIGDTRPEWPTGSIVDHAKARGLKPEPGQWHVIDATLTGDRAAVKLDNYSVADAKNLRSPAGYVSLACSRGAKVQFRNVRLKPLEMKALFNGTDLSGWKMVGAPPAEKVGILKKMVGAGDKPKDAAWTVANQLVHVEKGTGRLETAGTYDDFVFQSTIRVNLKDRADPPRSSIFFRGDAGKLATGYEVQTGSLGKLQPARKLAAPRANEFFTQTIATRGRHIQIWIDGVAVADYQDPRAEGTAPQKDARTAAGTIALEAPDDKTNIDYRGLRVLQLPKAFGKTAVTLTASPFGAGVAVPPGGPGGTVPPPVPGQSPDVTKLQIQQLMQQVLATNEPEQQAALYSRILILDPNNSVAFTGREKAQEKIEAARAKQSKEIETKTQEAATEEQKKTEGEAALKGAEDALVLKDFSKARELLSIATRLNPGGSPRITLVQNALDRADNLEATLKYMLTGAGALALVGGVVLFIRSRGQKTPFLEVVEGVDKGKRYTLDQEVTHIGAIAQDGGEKNEIVVRDVERMVSRFHCEVHARGKQVYVIDCGSANGTKVDKTRLKAGKAVPLKKGGRIDLAGTVVMRLGMQRKANG